MANDFEAGKKIEDLGNPLVKDYLIKKGILHHFYEDKEHQKKGIDLRIDDRGMFLAIDLKFDTYRRDSSVLIELSQKTDKGWLDGEKETEKIWFCQCSENMIFQVDFKSLLNIDYSRYTAYPTKDTGATFCLVPLSDIKIEKAFYVDFSAMENFFKNDVIMR